MIRLPGSVADIIAPNTRQSVKASQLGYSRRVKPNMRPLQLHHKHNTLLCIHLKTNHINSILLFISDLECTDKSDTVTKNCTGTFHSHHDECVKPGIHYPCSRPMFTIDISDTHEHWTWAVQYTWAPVHTTYVYWLWTWVSKMTPFPLAPGSGLTFLTPMNTEHGPYIWAPVHTTYVYWLWIWVSKMTPSPVFTTDIFDTHVVVVVCIRSHNWSARQRHHRLQSVV